MRFTDEEIYKLFGNEAAESEDPDALRAYYLKNEIFDQVKAQLPLRILVGHKGTGKSALFRVAELEDEENGVLSITIRPDDVLSIASSEEDMLKLIREWKKGLREIIFSKVFEKFSIHEDKVKRYALAAGSILNVLAEALKGLKGEVKLDPVREKILNSFFSKSAISIYIDDLDRGWEAKKSDIKRISALLNAARDISSEMSGVRFKISLRSDVYFLVRTADESADKIEGSVVWFKWTNHEILALLVKRVNHYFSIKEKDADIIDMTQDQMTERLGLIMDKRYNGKGKWADIPTHRMLMSLVRRRPRDLIKLCTMASKEAYKLKADKIGTRHFEKIFDQYSQERLQDTVNEFRSELKNIEKLLLNMRPTKKEKALGVSFLFTTAQLLAKLSEIKGRETFVLANGKTADAAELIRFLFKINFIHARKEISDGTIDRKYFEDNRYISNIDFGYGWEVHAAYRWALQPESLDDVFNAMPAS